MSISDKYKRGAVTRHRNKLIYNFNQLATEFPKDVRLFMLYRDTHEKILFPPNHYISAKETLNSLVKVFKELIK